MKILQINTVYGKGSTGSILKAIQSECKKRDIGCISAYRGIEKGTELYEGTIRISSKWDSRIHGWWSRYTMFKGTGSYLKTWLFLNKVKKYNPDIVHLHNLHGSYVNIPMLVKYIKKNNIPVVWTFHDCWPFTAICSHFVMAKCDKWKEGCKNCPQKKRFSSAVVDATPMVWNLKKSWFTGFSDSILVTPSNWMAQLIKESFLKEYDIEVIYNGIDLNIFKETASDFREKYNLRNKKIVLGVAFDWSYSKGLDVFISLSEQLDDNYKVVLVGTNDKIDKLLPPNVLSIHRTNNQKELAEIYTAADVFVNPTREDTFPTVNLEAMACGCPVITFNTGGSPESVDDTCGAVIFDEDINNLREKIVDICEKNMILRTNCRNKAMQFNKDDAINSYIDVYKKVLKIVKTD